MVEFHETDQNERFVVRNTNWEGAWYFRGLQTSAETHAEIPLEILHIVGAILSHADGFIQPRRVDVPVGTLSEEESHTDLSMDTDSYSSLANYRGYYDTYDIPEKERDYNTVVQLGSYFTGAGIRDPRIDFDVPDGRVAHFTSIRIELAARMWLPGVDEFMGPGSPRFCSVDKSGGEEYGEVISTNSCPLALNIGRSPPKGESTNYECQLVFRTHCPTWFVASEVGERNRQRLNQLFRFVACEFDVSESEFFSEEVYTNGEHLDPLRPESYL